MDNEDPDHRGRGLESGDKKKEESLLPKKKIKKRGVLKDTELASGAKALPMNHNERRANPNMTQPQAKTPAE